MKLEISDFPDELITQLAEKLAGKIAQQAKGGPYTVAQFARLIGRSRGYVKTRVDAGIIVKADMPGDTLIAHSELERFRNGGTAPGSK